MFQFPLFSYLSNVVPSPPLTAFTNKFGAHAWETRLAPFAQRLLYLLLRFLGIGLSAICWQLYSHVFNCWRHVENQVILMPDNATKTPAVQMLLRDVFYIPAVELEIVNDHHFVLPNQRRMTLILYIVHDCSHNTMGRFDIPTALVIRNCFIRAYVAEWRWFSRIPFHVQNLNHKLGVLAGSSSTTAMNKVGSRIIGTGQTKDAPTNLSSV